MKALKSLRKIVAAIGLLSFISLQAEEAKYIFYFIIYEVAFPTPNVTQNIIQISSRVSLLSQ